MHASLSDRLITFLLNGGPGSGSAWLNRDAFEPKRVEFHYYDAGHMMYVREADLAKLSAGIRAFIRKR